MAENPNRSKLDQQQILQRVMNEPDDRLRVDAVASIESGSMEVVISQTDDSIVVYGNDGSSNKVIKTDSSGTVSINDGGNSVTVDGTVGITGTVPISASSLPLPTGAATAALQTQPGVDIGDVTVNNSSGGGAVNIQDGGNSITVDGTVAISSLPLPTGAATAALQTQPGVDIGDVTINNASGASAVNIQDGGNSITVDGIVSTTQLTSSTSTVTSVSGSASSVQLLASNGSRKQALFYNDSTKVLYLKFGTTASTTSFTVKLIADAYYELPQPIYTGRIDGIWASASGAARITELT